jgi:hypothetical protein
VNQSFFEYIYSYIFIKEYFLKVNETIFQEESLNPIIQESFVKSEQINLTHLIPDGPSQVITI